MNLLIAGANSRNYCVDLFLLLMFISFGNIGMCIGKTLLLRTSFTITRDVHTLLLLHTFGYRKHTILTQVGHKNVQQLFLLLRHVAVSDILNFSFFTATWVPI